jgi:guanine nucleotide-binding protein subunit alpha-12
MQIIHGHNFDSAHLIEYRQTIYSNVIKGMKVLIDALRKLHVSWQNPSNVSLAEHVFTYQNQPLGPTLFAEYSHQVRLLWQDDGIRETYERRAEFQIVSTLRTLPRPSLDLTLRCRPIVATEDRVTEFDTFSKIYIGFRK